MPIRLSDLSRDERTVVLDWDGEQAELVYKPSGYTPAVEQELNADMTANLPNVAIAKMLSGLLKSWDVLDENEKPISTDFETLRKFPTEFLQAALAAVTGDQAASREERKNSGGGSPRKAK